MKKGRLDTYHQREEAWRLLGHGFEGTNKKQKGRELGMLSLLLRDVWGLKGKELQKELERFCEKWIQCYCFRAYYAEILRAVHYASDRKNVLIQVDALPVYAGEAEWIQGLDLPLADQKLMFAVMMTKRMDEECYKQRHGEGYNQGFLSADGGKLRRLRRGAGLTSSDDMAGLILHRWLEKGLIRSTYTGFVLDFLAEMPHDGEKVMEVRHYDCYGSYYLCLLEGERRAMCQKCGKPILKGKTRKKFCKDCALEFFHVKEPAAKKFVCEKCGREFYAEARAVKTNQCPDCKRGRVCNGTVDRA